MEAIPRIIEMEDELQSLSRQAQIFAVGAKAASTVKAYQKDWEDFHVWCSQYRLNTLPADSQTVCLYLSFLAKKYSTSSIKRKMASIIHFHMEAGYPSPRDISSVSSVLRGIIRHKGSAQKGQKPLLKNDIEKMVTNLPITVKGIRDKAIILLGFFSAMRRSEISGLNCDDIEFCREGIIIHLRKSKTDQEQEGRRIGVAYEDDKNLCPVLAVKKWTGESNIQSGVLFRGINKHEQISDCRLSAPAISALVKLYAENAGIDSSEISAHSLRSGFCTESAKNGVSERLIMRQTGHTSESTVRKYIRDSTLFSKQI